MSSQVKKIKRSFIRGDSLNSPEILMYQDADRTIPVDLTGVVARGQLKAKCGGALVTNIACTVFPAQGKITYNVPPSITETLTVGEYYVYDIEATYPSGTRQTIFVCELLIVSDFTV